MTIEGANSFSENDNSTIYTMNSTQTGQYCVIIPKNTDNSINMLVDLNMKNSFDSLANNTTDKDSLIKEITEEYNNIASKYPSGILVLPMLDTTELGNIINSNDKQKMLDETKKIGSITSEIYQKLSSAGIDKSKIDQKIIIVEKTENDNKFVSWLKEQMPNFVEGAKYEELSKNNVDSANENVNPFTGETTEAIPTPTNDIFGAPAPVEPAPVPEPVPSPEPVENVETTPEPTVEEPSAENTEEENAEEPAVEPQPITDTKLETTQAIPNVEEVPASTPVEPATNETTEEAHELDKKSGGFANLLILAVILIIVTIASIELGKFLYSNFGA